MEKLGIIVNYRTGDDNEELYVVKPIAKNHHSGKIVFCYKNNTMLKLSSLVLYEVTKEHKKSTADEGIIKKVGENGGIDKLLFEIESKWKKKKDSLSLPNDIKKHFTTYLLSIKSAYKNADLESANSNVGYLKELFNKVTESKDYSEEDIIDFVELLEEIYKATKITDEKIRKFKNISHYFKGKISHDSRGLVGIIINYGSKGDPIVKPLITDGGKSKKIVVLRNVNNNPEMGSLVKYRLVKKNAMESVNYGKLEEILTDGELDRLTTRIDKVWHENQEYFNIPYTVKDSFSDNMLLLIDAYEEGDLKKVIDSAINSYTAIKNIDLDGSIKDEDMIFHGIQYLMLELIKTAKKTDKIAKEHLTIS